VLLLFLFLILRQTLERLDDKPVLDNNVEQLLRDTVRYPTVEVKR
jgi:hypothetical protein